TNPRCACATNKVHRSWSAKEKLMVIYYLERTNNVRATTKRFDIKLKQVQLRNMYNAVTQNMVVRKAKALAQTDKIKNAYPDIASFKFSINWL
ncbi:38264_t:CDS:2, partial [Gigaspora margarita]